jgi:hypothetical protein
MRAMTARGASSTSHGLSSLRDTAPLRRFSSDLVKDSLLVTSSRPAAGNGQNEHRAAKQRKQHQRPERSTCQPRTNAQVSTAAMKRQSLQPTVHSPVTAASLTPVTRRRFVVAA